MKKLFNSKFLIILASSLVMLIVLVIGAFYLFDDKDSVFVKSGYVLNPLSSTSEKYYFNENVGYRENLSSMIEFVSIDDKTVSVLKDSFVHYLDESISLLKNGAILDLDSVKGSVAVSFYNITNESIIENKDNGYVIASVNGDIELDNFIARISDNKYIVVGESVLKMVGNETDVNGEYFEIVYVEEGIVNIENKDVKYQVAAEGTNISIGGKVIDLGNKTIKIGDEDIMSITEITIDGDENIEIIPKDVEEEDDDESNSGGGGDVNGGTTNSGSLDGTGTGNENNDGTTENDDGSDTGSGDSGVKEETEITTVTLKEFKIGSVSIDVIFDIVNSKSDDKFVLQVVNLTSGKYVVINEKNEFPVTSDEVINIINLTPDTKYLFMVINKNEGNVKYFNKVLETSKFGIDLQKDVFTATSLSYDIIIDEEYDVKDAVISLEKFNENSGDYEPVVGQEKNLVDLMETKKVSFNNLEPDTIYTIIVDNFSLKSTETTIVDKYKKTFTALTLKKRPEGLEKAILSVITSEEGGDSYELKLEGVDDKYNAIVNYRYEIDEHNLDDPSKNKNIFDKVMEDDSSVFVSTGTGSNDIKGTDSGYDYFARVIVEYFDNEKYLDYIIGDVKLPKLHVNSYVSIETTSVSYDSFSVKIKLLDDGCSIYGPNREAECLGKSSTVVYVKRINESTGQPYDEEPIAFEREFLKDPANGDLYISLTVPNLDEDAKYEIEVKACKGKEECGALSVIDSSVLERYVRTKSFANIKVNWGNHISNANSVLNVPIKLVEVPTESGNVLSIEETLNLIKGVRISLYEGAWDDVNAFKYITAETVPYDIYDIRGEIWNKDFTVDTIDTFKVTKTYLESVSNTPGTLNREYTILVEAFMDEDCTIPFNKLSTNFMSYAVNPILIYGDVLTTLKKKNIYYNDLVKEEFFDKELFGEFDKNLEVGYKLGGSFDRTKIPDTEQVSVRIKVYDTNAKKNVDFYYKDNETNTIKKTSGGYKSISLAPGVGYFSGFEIYMTKGISYVDNQFDDIMASGNSYYVGYEIVTSNGPLDTPITADGDEDDVIDATDKEDDKEKYVKHPSGKGVYKRGGRNKEMPKLKIYNSKSTSDSITYKYTIDDPDNALYKDPKNGYSFYYTVSSGKEVSVPMNVLENSKYDGELVIEGLSKGNVYSFYFKQNTLKQGSVSKDVVNAASSDKAENRLFDGYYDFSLEEDISKYNFRYEIVSDIENDSRLIIKILANDGFDKNNNILDRILSYKVELIPLKGESKIFRLGDSGMNELTTCPNDEPGVQPSCLEIDYVDIKDMISTSTSNINKITVKVSAIYDNGLTGVDYLADNNYEYMIFQTNGSSTSVGDYVGLSVSNNPQLLSSANLNTKGYYKGGTWRVYSNEASLMYKRMVDKNNVLTSGGKEVKKDLTFRLDTLGYKVNDFVVNPKMVSEDDMSCLVNNTDSCNTFWFFSFAPEVKVENVKTLLDGAVYNLTLSNAQLENIKEENGEHKLYVYVWNRIPNVKEYVRTDGSFIYEPIKEYSVSVDYVDENGNMDPNGEAFEISLNGLKEQTLIDNDGLYTFAVFVKLKKMENGTIKYSLEQLADYADEKDNKLMYDFDSSIVDNFFTRIEVKKEKEEKYGVRNIRIVTELAKKNNVEFDFDLTYVLCDTIDYSKCSPNLDNEHIKVKDTVLKEEILALKSPYQLVKNHDVTGKDLEYGDEKPYYVYVYANYDNYFPGKSPVLLNPDPRVAKYSIEAFKEPDFKVTREAFYDSEIDDYGLKFAINPLDNDKVLVGGQFKLKLVDEEDNIVGKLDGDSNYLDKVMDASIDYPEIVFTGLESDKKYKLYIYNDIFMNNASIDKDKRTYLYEKIVTSNTLDHYNIAIGEWVDGITPNNLILNFSYGSGYNQSIEEVIYTIAKKDTVDYIAKGTYKIPDDKEFKEIYESNINIFQLGIDFDRLLSYDSEKDLGTYTYKLEFVFRDDISKEDKFVIGDSILFEKPKQN